MKGNGQWLEMQFYLVAGFISILVGLEFLDHTYQYREPLKTFLGTVSPAWQYRWAAGHVLGGLILFVLGFKIWKKRGEKD